MAADLYSNSVDNIQLSIKRKIHTQRREITGYCFLSEGRIVFTRFHDNYLSLINTKGVELLQIGRNKAGSCTYDTVYIEEDNSIAVSSVSNRRITIIDIDSKEVMATISMDTAIYAMAVRGRTIYYCTGSNGIKMLNLSDKSISDIISSNMYVTDCIATSGDKLYYTNSKTDTVTCCDLHGTTQWEFKDERVLRGPHGISVDNDGNIYVVAYVSNNVVVISPDEQRHRQLLSDKDGLLKPTILDYDRSTNRLIVLN